MAERELVGYSPVVRPGARTGEQIHDSTSFSAGYAVPDAPQPRTYEVLPGEAPEPPTSDNIAYGSINAAKQAKDELQTTARKNISVSLLLAALIVVTLILAVVGVAMAAVSLLNKSNSSELETLQLVVHELQLMVNELQHSLTARDAEVMQLRAGVANLSADNDALTSRVGSLFSNRTNVSASLLDLELYSNCTTTVEVSCTIPLGNSDVGFSPCETSPIDINSSDLLEAHCARTDGNPESNPIVTTLSVARDLGKMVCLCWVVIPGVFPQTELVTCGLIVTRCPPIQNLNTRIQYL